MRAVVEDGASTDELWKHMRELDWPALTIPEDCGGIGLGFVELAVVVEELGKVIGARAVPGDRHPVRADGPRGGHARAARALPRRRRPRRDHRHRRRRRGHRQLGRCGDVTATARRDGDGWVLDGTKRYVQDGASADEIAVVARLEGTTGDDGIAVFVVPQPPSRARRRSRRSTSPASTPPWCSTVCGSTPTGRSAPRARRAEGVRRAVEEATVALALEMVGTCQSIFDITLDYAKNRIQFDVPIGSFQAIKHKFADMFVALERARATAYFAAATLAEDDPRRSLAAAMAKAAAGDCQRLLAKEGIQIHGGIGYTWEHDMHLYVKRVKSGDAVFGTASTQRQRVADLIGL